MGYDSTYHSLCSWREMELTLSLTPKPKNAEWTPLVILPYYIIEVSEDIRQGVVKVGLEGIHNFQICMVGHFITCRPRWRAPSTVQISVLLLNLCCCELYPPSTVCETGIGDSHVKLSKAQVQLEPFEVVFLRFSLDCCLSVFFRPLKEWLQVLTNQQKTNITHLCRRFNTINLLVFIRALMKTSATYSLNVVTNVLCLLAQVISDNLYSFQSSAEFVLSEFNCINE